MDVVVTLRCYDVVVVLRWLSDGCSGDIKCYGDCLWM